jgi:anti-anti-sigma factor
MTFEKRYTDAGCVLRFSGEVDMTDAADLKQLERETHDSNVIVDVANLRYADTTFLRFLIRLRRHGSVRLIGANQTVRRVLDVTGLSRYFLPVSS